MNCKKGDLAVTVHLAHQKGKRAISNSGRIVECLRFIGLHQFSDGVTKPNVWACKLNGSPMVDAFQNEWSGTVLIDDANLRPIRDNPGNESFVVESRKELNKGKTEITERGEIA